MAETTSEQKSTGGGSSNVASNYLAEVRAEMKKVVWPTRPEAWRLTGVVLGITAFMTVLLYVFDYIFAEGLQILISQFLGI